MEEQTPGPIRNFAGHISIKFEDRRCAFDPENIVAITHDDPGIETSSNNTQVPSATTRYARSATRSGVKQGTDFVGSSNTAAATSCANSRPTRQPTPEPYHSSSSNAALQITTMPASL